VLKQLLLAGPPGVIAIAGIGGIVKRRWPTRSSGAPFAG
jgi:hypothetical protein